MTGSKLTTMQFDAARLGAYDAMRRYQLSKKQRKVVDFLILSTLAMSRARAWFPSFNDLVDGTGLYKPDLHLILNELVVAHVIDVDPWPPRKGVAFSALYGLNVLFDNWLLPADKAYIRAQQGLLELQDPDDLRAAIFENFVERGPRSLNTLPVSGFGVSKAALGHTAADRDVNLAAEPRGSRDVPGSGNTPRHHFSPEAGCPPGGAPVPVGTVSDLQTVGAGVPPATVSDSLTAAKSAREIRAAEAVSKSLTVNTNSAATVSGASAFPLVLPLVITEEQGELNEEQRSKPSTLKEQRARARGASKSLTVAGLTMGELVSLEQRVLAWVGPEDFSRSQKLWVNKILLNFPDTVSAVFARIDSMTQKGQLTFTPHALRDDGRPPGTDHRIRWLVAEIAKAAGVKSWAEVREGVFPRE